MQNATQPQDFYVTCWNPSDDGPRITVARTTLPPLPAQDAGLITPWILRDTGKAAGRIAFNVPARDANGYHVHIQNGPHSVGADGVVRFLTKPYGDRPPLMSEAEARALVENAPYIDPDLGGTVAALGIAADIVTALKEAF